MSATEQEHNNKMYAHTNRVRRVYREDKGGWFYEKEMNHPSDARRELVVQEFFHLINPQQPRTFLEFDKFGLPCLYSQEVVGFKKLGKLLNDADAVANLPGFATSVLTAMFMQEIDLKDGNIGVDVHGNVIKIDGNNALVYLYDPSKYPENLFNITLHSLKGLPYPKGFAVFNWLHYFDNTEKRAAALGLGPSEIANNPKFQKELFSAILKICCLTNEPVERFIDAVDIPGGGNEFVNLILDRCDDLEKAANQWPEYKAFCQSHEAEQIRINHQEHLNNYFESFAIEPLLKQIETCALSKEDKLIFNYCSTIRHELSSTTKLRSVEDIKNEVLETLASVNSDQVKTLKGKITEYQESWTNFFVPSKQEKAERIKTAFFSTPLKKRSNVLLHRGLANNVQKELARHRSGSEELFLCDGFVDEKLAAEGYRQLCRPRVMI